MYFFFFNLKNNFYIAFLQNLKRKSKDFLLLKTNTTATTFTIKKACKYFS